MRKQQLHFWGLFFSSIIGLVVPFVFGRLGWVAFISLVPFFLFLEFCEARFRKRQQMLFCCLIGLGSMAGILYWSVQTMPERWAYIHGWAATAGLWINYALFAGLFALQFLLFGLLYVKQQPILFRKRAFIIMPAIWVLCEFARSFVFSLFAYGHNGSIGANWNFGNLGLAASTTYLGYATRIVGMYGLSFMAVATSLAIVWLIRRKNLGAMLVLVWVAVALSLAGNLLYQPSEDVKRLAFIQTPPNFGDPTIRSHLLDKARAQNDQRNVDVLVLPEYGNIFEDQNDTSVRRDGQSLIKPEKGYIVTSALVSTPQLLSNQLRVYNSNLDSVASYNKYFLIPVGEYMPYIHQGILKIMGQQQAIKLNQEHRGTQRGAEPIPVIHLPGISLGSQICSGAIAPTLYQKQTQAGAQVLTNSASLSMFSQAPSYQVQSYQLSRFMAVANARPFVQAAEGGHGYILDTTGAQKSGDNRFDYFFGVADISLVKRRTVYSIMGEWILWMSTLVVILSLISGRKKSK